MIKNITSVFRIFLLLGGLILAGSPALTDAGHSTGLTQRVSVNPGGEELDGESRQATLAADGRFLVFWSRATNLDPGDPDPRPDVFRRDLETGEVVLVSMNDQGVKGNRSSSSPSISGDGRLVAFSSFADNLVPGDQNDFSDIFLRDLQAGTTIRLSESSAGAGGNQHSVAPFVSADGRFVAFQSYASNLVVDDRNEHFDVFVYEVATGELEIVSSGHNGDPGNGHTNGIPFLSSDGRLLVFESSADNLVPSDTNGTWDLFLHDRQTGETTLVSVASDGTQANAGPSYGYAFSEDGRWVAFSTPADNLVPGDDAGWQDIFLHDRQTGVTTRVSRAGHGEEANGASIGPSLSGDGRFVSYTSWADNLVHQDLNGQEDVFVFDQLTGDTQLVSLSSFGVQGDDWSDFSRLSTDGRLVTFTSVAMNLIPDDNNGAADLFLHNRFLSNRLYFPLVLRSPR